jgi:hypothetical protein
MCFGLPGRTSNTTAEEATIELLRIVLPVVRDEAGLLDHLHVGVEGERDDVGREAVDHVRAPASCSSE